MWDKAQLEERHTILKGFLDCVYVDLAEPPTLVGIKPKPQFLEFLGRVGTEEGAPGKSENEDSDAENASESILTGWWRRGREPVSEIPRHDAIRKSVSIVSDFNALPVRYHAIIGLYCT